MFLSFMISTDSNCSTPPT